MNLRNLIVLTIAIFGISIMAMADEPKVEWEYGKGGLGMGVIRNASFDDVWNKIQDILFWEKFKPKGAVWKHTFEPITVEKSSGLISVEGWCKSSFLYTFKIMTREKDGQIIVKTQCNSLWKKKVTQKFWQLLEEGF